MNGKAVVVPLTSALLSQCMRALTEASSLLQTVLEAAPSSMTRAVSSHTTVSSSFDSKLKAYHAPASKSWSAVSSSPSLTYVAVMSYMFLMAKTFGCDRCYVCKSATCACQYTEEYDQPALALHARAAAYHPFLMAPLAVNLAGVSLGTGIALNRSQHVDIHRGVVLWAADTECVHSRGKVAPCCSFPGRTGPMA